MNWNIMLTQSNQLNLFQPNVGFCRYRLNECFSIFLLARILLYPEPCCHILFRVLRRFFRYAMAPGRLMPRSNADVTEVSEKKKNEKIKKKKKKKKKKQNKKKKKKKRKRKTKRIISCFSLFFSASFTPRNAIGASAGLPRRAVFDGVATPPP